MASGTFSIFFRSIATIKPHVPLIKFRKGGLSNGPHGASRASTPTAAGPAVSSKSKNQAIARPILEDYQLPLKYRRIPLDEAEINAINSGGC